MHQKKIILVDELVMPMDNEAAAVGPVQGPSHFFKDSTRWTTSDAPIVSRQLMGDQI